MERQSWSTRVQCRSRTVANRVGPNIFVQLLNVPVSQLSSTGQTVGSLLISLGSPEDELVAANECADEEDPDGVVQEAVCRETRYALRMRMR